MNTEIDTPFFLIYEDVLKQNLKEFKGALGRNWPNSTIAYSVKTNSLPWLLEWTNNHGVMAEVVSDDEYQLAQLSGYTEDNIVFNGPIKTDDYLDRAFKGGSIVNIDSKNELHYISKRKPSVKGQIGIRINVDPVIFRSNDIGYQEYGFRFGFSDENGELQNAISTLESVYGDKHIGLHMHVNSITRSVEVYKALAQYAAIIVNKYGLKPPFIDIGGGFFGGVPGKATPNEYISIIKNELNRVIDTSYTKLILEPGSALIGSAVELHTSVIDVKDTALSRIVTTDGSRVHIDPLWKKKSYLYYTDARKKSYNKQIICGYTCMDHDRIMTIQNEPELSVGDRIVYRRVGNYTITFGGPFIKPYPPVYAIVDNEMVKVRKAMTIEDYYRLETV